MELAFRDFDLVPRLPLFALGGISHHAKGYWLWSSDQTCLALPSILPLEPEPSVARLAFARAAFARAAFARARLALAGLALAGLARVRLAVPGRREPEWPARTYTLPACQPVHP